MSLYNTPSNLLNSEPQKAGNHNLRNRSSEEIKAQACFEAELISLNASLPSRLRQAGYQVIIRDAKDPLKKVGGVEVLPDFRHRYDEIGKKHYVAFEVR